jgi:hypothetical protein
MRTTAADERYPHESLAGQALDEPHLGRNPKVLLVLVIILGGWVLLAGAADVVQLRAFGPATAQVPMPDNDLVAPTGRSGRGPR